MVERRVVSVRIDKDDAVLMLDDGSVLRGILSATAKRASVDELPTWEASGYIMSSPFAVIDRDADELHARRMG